MITAGVDIGSTTSKVVLLNDDGIMAREVIVNGALPADSAWDLFQNTLINAGIQRKAVAAVAMTGYGRRLANFGDMIITEIKSCGLGAVAQTCPAGQIYTVIDVGGQDTKVISLNDDGDVEDFAMNDKCAAGTGRFLEMLAHKLGLTYPAFVEVALQSTAMIQMNSTCAVFAESEVVSLLARGIDKADIAAAAHEAIAQRIGTMVRRIGSKEVFCFTGGGAINRALAKTLEEALNKKVFIPPSPQTVVAQGAAIAARQKLEQGEKT
ncbi:MAG: 2-hydroxyglutaryl-CoA dehydratase [Verrucomicrobia bacterium]|nr:2-hydroxyglutaryl-CoA dehydratase [Verrucomicrobiota bacterium]MBU4247243.1 2-hydroxyglutaryl-CoA dehydratase [Verrucomicrobiota bacterium]MBU4289951.1 2-hydroxyglutaryl-CoA dehydratase [Verrucomicrobiota bacterium]MBU4498054.1 2-hydroxyglutaryl-CoA dehydratase [Verrucomicrobiota bacterium]MCG2679701.1 acyl-CoA dehydratase activase [Kiritimatiellia bacterium]